MRQALLGENPVRRASALNESCATGKEREHHRLRVGQPRLSLAKFERGRGRLVVGGDYVDPAGVGGMDALLIPDQAVASLMCEMRPVTQRVVDKKGRVYLRLQKYLYGLSQASFRFYQSSTESSSAWFSRRYGATLASTAEKRVT